MAGSVGDQSNGQSLTSFSQGRAALLGIPSGEKGYASRYSGQSALD
jgi:hypothetical protein